MRGSLDQPWALGLFVIGLLAFPYPAYSIFDPVTPNPVSGRPMSAQTIIPADVLARAELVRDELEPIRFEMGKPTGDLRGVLVTNAAPHEVFFQALTLLKKANVLVLEQSGHLGAESKFDAPPDIRPFHVWRVVNAAYKRILILKHDLGITHSVKERLQDDSVTPTDVFRTITLANREASALLDRQFLPSEVLQQVTLAINHAGSLLARFPGAVRLPDPPAFQRGKRPFDVYVRLIECYQKLGAIAERSNLKMLSLDISSLSLGEIRPSDVYDMATLLVSDLAYLRAQAKIVDRPSQPSQQDDRKFPSHVYQQSGVLLLQLADLEHRVRKNPGWIEH